MFFTKGTDSWADWIQDYFHMLDDAHEVIRISEFINEEIDKISNMLKISSSRLKRK